MGCGLWLSILGSFVHILPRDHAASTIAPCMHHASGTFWPNELAENVFNYALGNRPIECQLH